MRKRPRCADVMVGSWRAQVATFSSERRLYNPASGLAIRGLACGEQDGRLAGYAVPLGWLEAGVVEQAEVGRQLVDPAAGCA